MSKTVFNENQSVCGFRLLTLVGVGARCEIWSAIEEKTNNVVALKIFHAFVNAGKEAEYEYSMSVMFQHPSILNTFRICQVDGYYAIVMPFCTARSVDGLAGYISVTYVWKLLYDIAAALSVIHCSEYGHFNVKPSNILWNGKAFVLSDFGFCKKISEEKTIIPVLDNSDDNSYQFDAPEFSEGYRVVESDLWSLGATAFNLYMGCNIFNGLGGRAQKKESPLPYMRKTLPELSNLICQCLIFDYRQRPTAESISLIAKEQLQQCLDVKKVRPLKINVDNFAQSTEICNFWPDEMIES
jgi:serine/threonine protein kinase